MAVSYRAKENFCPDDAAAPLCALKINFRRYLQSCVLLWATAVKMQIMIYLKKVLTAPSPAALTTQKIIDTGFGLIGFHRLAIMGLTDGGMQPFMSEDQYLVCNGEIYGFRPIKKALMRKGYTFQSESDCEILLPMYQEYGTDMFKN